ncbi:YueI family protein [uncultured Secundilactobacillus sp.]|uniref:YueI family protein n=1 Tax=uncultured Secundilactobacillus sp. TaxID=2813935 RepID=UPI00258338D5|nr:YueI family protein [uncultured Secundilactobacillus sp.]
MADRDDLTSHLDNAIYGTPKLHPDEQRQYLGTFRERVSLRMTIQQVTDQIGLAGFKAELEANPDFHVIFNGHIDSQALSPYMQAASAAKIEFTIVQDAFYGDQPTSSGLIVASDHAIDAYPIDVTQKYPETSSATQNTTEKKSFGDRLKDLFSGH